jgi:hypothetical protein
LLSINSSFEAELFPALRVFDGDVVFARPVDFQTGFLQSGENIRTVSDYIGFKFYLKIRVNRILGFGPVILARILAPADEAGFVQVGMVGSSVPRSVRVVRSGPSFTMVVQVAEHVEVLLPTGRAGVEIFAARQIQTWDDKMQFMMPGMAVPHPEDSALIRFQSGKGDLFEIIHDALFLFRRHRVVRVPREYSRRELPFPVNGVDKVAGHVRVAAQDFRRRFLPAGVIRAHKIPGGHVAVALPVWKDLHVHGSSSVFGTACASRSRHARAISTSRASARRLWTFAQRAS